MYIVYILFSTTLDRYYIGYTGDDIHHRITKHNSKHIGFTGKTNDWQLKHCEEFALKAEAMSREKEIKNWKSRLRIEKLIASK